MVRTVAVLCVMGCWRRRAAAQRVATRQRQTSSGQHRGHRHQPVWGVCDDRKRGDASAMTLPGTETGNRLNHEL